jgi:hypothetical protein
MSSYKLNITILIDLRGVYPELAEESQSAHRSVILFFIVPVSFENDLFSKQELAQSKPLAAIN